MVSIRKNKNNTYSVRVEVFANNKDKLITIGSFKNLTETKDLSNLVVDILNDSDIYASMSQYELIIPNIFSDKKEAEKAEKGIKRIFKCFISKEDWYDYGL